MTEKMCECTLKSGGKCSRKAKEGSKYCWQHINCGSQKTTTHVPFKIMLARAVVCDSGGNTKRDGNSRSFIKKYLLANYNIEPKEKRNINNISRAIKNGDIGSNPRKTGHYRLSKELAAKLKKYDEK